MKRFAKRCLAVILSIVMVFSINPVQANAAATAGTYVKVTNQSQLTSGNYVMVVSSGYAAGALASGWLGAGDPATYTIEDSKVKNPDSSLIWNVTVSATSASGSSITLKDASNTSVKPTGSNANGITSGDYTWLCVFNDTNKTFSIQGSGGDTVTLASNTDPAYGNKFRAYKNTTVAGSATTYLSAFSLYKSDSSAPSGPVKAATPTANPPSGTVASGSAITLTSTTSGSNIQYRVNAASSSAIWVDYSGPITINSDSIIEAKAKSPDSLESDTATFTYTLAKEAVSDPSLIDPIASIPSGSLSVLEAAQAATGQAISVVGQLVYKFGNYDSANSSILQDVIDGKVYAIQIYDALSDYKIGDIVKLTGTTSVYGGVPQVQTLTAKELITPASPASLIAAQEFTSINEMKAYKASLLSEWVVLRNVTLGTYNNNGSTTITDNSGISIPIYRAATYPFEVIAGEKVDLYACFSKNNANDQLRVGNSSDYVVINDTKAPNITLLPLIDAEKGKDYNFLATIRDNVGATEATLVYTVKGVPVTVSLVKNSTNNTKWETTIPSSAFATGVTEFTVQVSTKDKAGNNATSTLETVAVTDDPQVTTVTPARNAKTGDVKKPLISVSAVNLGTAPTATLTLKLSETSIITAASMSYASGTFSFTPSENLADGRYTASVVITRADGKSITYEWPFNIGTTENSLYFGQLHSHTTYSDGSGSIDEALNYINSISDNDNIDFVAFTDHSNYFDTKDAINPEAALYDTTQMTTGSKAMWNEFKSKVAAFNSSPTNRGVIALGGFEMTWSGGPGHMNTWNTAGVVSRNNATLNSKTNDAGMKAYYALLSQPDGANTVSQFNHPGTTFGTFSDFAYLDPIIDSRVSLVEVGNGEGAIGSGGYFPSYNYYTMALDKGWHLAPTNNQDNHKGKWGNANDARDVILTDDFTEQGIYDALRDRKVYASEDKNLEILYTVNNKEMGSIISEVPTSLNLAVTLSDADDEIQKAEVIANSGRVVYSWEVNSLSKELTTTLAPTYSYYYIRVTEKDGDLAVTAPVWVGSTKLLGISNVTSSSSTPVTGENLKVQTTLFNSETTDVTVTSLTYKLDGAVLDTKSNAGTIAKGTNLTIDFDFTPVKAKLQTMTVDVVLTIEGVDYTFTKDVVLDVRDASKLVYIGIDGSHYNEYVAGNYKDSMGNFSKLAAQSNVRCVILTTSDELIAAAQNVNGKYKMLILTAPSRRNGTVLREPYKNYTEEELAAIKGFSEAGGSLVLCGWSDLYENYKPFPAADHMSAQQNKLLNTIGATLRISDDSAVDDVLNGGGTNGQARLYLSTYNWDNFLTKGIIYDAKYPNDNKYTQRFSQYGGGTIYAVDKEGNPTSVLPSNVSPIVYGHSTTYSKDVDLDGRGGSATPKYEYATGDNRVMVLASETITHANGTQSLVIVDGAAFMSNFEIQATIADTNAELNYSNYPILQNLIQYVNPTQIDKIADVQKEAEEGVTFTVEGIVTSNASGFDKTTAFFDCIYLQDETAGINAFPVAGDYKVGQKVRISGTTSSYQGERQLNVKTVSLVNSDVTSVQPIEVTAKQINDRTYLGNLVKISGTVKSYEVANGAIQTILVNDSIGNTARIFIDGYITTTKTINNLAIGNYITAVGLSSYDNTFAGLAARIRVRDRVDIVCTQNTSTSGSTGTTTTPSPSTTPVPTPPVTAPVETVVTVDKAVSSVTNGKATVKVEVSEKLLTDSVKDGNNNITLSLGTEILKDALTDNKVKNGVVIDISIPEVKDASVNKIGLSNEALLLAKESGQKLTINVADEKGYTVSIPASELKKITADSKDLNIAVSLQKDTEAARSSAGVLTIGSEGTLAAGMTVTVPVKDTLSVSAGDKVYVYYKNASTGKLEEIPNNRQTISDNGSLKISTISGGDYVICTEKVKDAVKLVDKAEVSAKSSVEVGKKLSVNVSLPKELAQVVTFAKGDPIGQEEAKVTYKVNNSSIATVSSDGTLVAKKKGLVTVTVEVTLENGDKKTFTKKIRIK